MSDQTNKASHEVLLTNEGAFDAVFAAASSPGLWSDAITTAPGLLRCQAAATILRSYGRDRAMVFDISSASHQVDLHRWPRTHPFGTRVPVRGNRQVLRFTEIVPEPKILRSEIRADSSGQLCFDHDLRLDLRRGGDPARCGHGMRRVQRR